jgi:hypothetical protein
MSLDNNREGSTPGEDWSSRAWPFDPEIPTILVGDPYAVLIQQLLQVRWNPEDRASTRDAVERLFNASQGCIALANEMLAHNARLAIGTPGTGKSRTDLGALVAARPRVRRRK